MTSLDRFAAHLAQPQITPEELALDVADIAYAGLDARRCLGQIDALADYVGDRLRAKAAAGPGALSLAHRLVEIINGELGFHGAHDDYYDPRNSLLNDVLERRTGLPIMLCLVCMAVGRRLDLAVSGLGFPSHFMAYFDDGATGWLIDPFHAVVVERAQGAAYLSQVVGRPMRLAGDAWRPVTPTMLAYRILNNLHNAFLLQNSFPLVHKTLDYLLVAAPNEAQHWRERGLLHHREANWDQAQRDLRRYFMLSDLLPHIIGTAAGGEEGAETEGISAEDQHVLRLYRESVATLARLN